MLRLLTSFLLAALASGSQPTVNIPSSHFSNPSSRVVNGVPVVPHNKWPWQVLLLWDNNGIMEPMCGGTLIERNWVMTAGHCFFFNVTYYVLAGKYNLSLPVDPEEFILVEKFIIHPDYGYAINGYDIALGRLDHCVELTENIQLAKLPPPSYKVPHGTPCYVIGWGLITSDGEASDVLHEGLLPVVDHEHCSQPEYWGNTVRQLHLCAGGEGPAACNGDSGGSLNCPAEDGSWEVQGIVSFGNKQQCEDPTKPSVFTRVSCFVDWIKLVLSTCSCCP